METQKTEIQILNPDKIWVKTWGEKLGSPYVERRKLHIESNIDLDQLMQVIIDAIDMLRSDRSDRSDILPLPWWLQDGESCKYCEKQRELATKLNLPLDTWRTVYCLRHGALISIDDLPLIDNKTRMFVFSLADGKLYYVTQSVKWLFSVELSSDYAKINVYNYQRRSLLTYTYRNYDSSSSYSSYSYVKSILYDKLNLLYRILICDKWDNVNVIYSPISEIGSIFYNGELICSPSE